MGSIYQLIFFLAIALLAIVITVFVLAVSLLGRAVKLSAQEQTEAEEKRKKDTENEIKKIQDKLKKAKAAGRVDVKDLTRSLQDLESRDTRHKWKLRWIKIKPKLLTASWGALIPGALFLISAIFSGLAFNQLGETATVSLYMWISLIALGIGICFVCLTLKVIQGVAITSEETAFVRQKDMYKAALIEFEEEKTPHLELAFVDEEPPFQIEAGKEKTIQFVVGLTRGEIARKPKVTFLAPSGFYFPRKETWLQPKNKQHIGGYITCRFDFSDISGSAQSMGKLKIKAPSQADTYNLKYIISCEKFESDHKEFAVEVK